MVHHIVLNGVLLMISAFCMLLCYERCVHIWKLIPIKRAQNILKYKTHTGLDTCRWWQRCYKNNTVDIHRT